MSYDLFFKPKKGDISVEQFTSYFQGRKNYTLEGSQAWYQNETTGVYFLFEHQELDDTEEEFFPVAFNMNYFRPTFFLNEAEQEVSAFISQFDLSIEDPQINGMGSGDFDIGRFRSGWLEGNELGYQAILKSSPEVFCLPTKQLDDIWRWNINKDALIEQTTDDAFVPSIMLVNYQDKIVTACVWTDAIPSIMPPVDILIIVRKELAPRKFFRRVQDMAISDWQDVKPLFEQYKQKKHGDAYYLSYRSAPNEIKQYVKGLPTIDISSFEILPADQVLNAELVEKYST